MADDKKKPKIKIKKVPKLTKVGLLKTVVGAIPAALKARKTKILEAKRKAEEIARKKKTEITGYQSTATKAQSQAAKTYDDLSPEMKRQVDNLDKPGWSMARKIKWILGGGAATTVLGGGAKLTYDVAKEMDKAKGGYVRKMKAGGSVSRGTGAAIKGTKFKGVF